MSESTSNAPVILGLDPATTGFLGDDVSVRLDKTDAQFNDNIYTTWGEGGGR